MSNRELRTRTKVNYTEEKIDNQSAFRTQKKTTRKRKEAASASSKGPKAKRAGTRKGRKTRREPTESEEEGENVPEGDADTPEAHVPEAVVPEEEGDVPIVPNMPAVEANPNVPTIEDNPVVPTLVSRGVQTVQRLPEQPAPERTTLFSLPPELRLPIYDLIVPDESVYKDIPGYRTGDNGIVNKAVWRAHISGILGALGNRQILSETQGDPLSERDRTLDPVVWISWASLSQLPRLLQMITEALRLEQRYINAHAAQPNRNESDWKRVQRLWDVIVDIPVHEYLNPEGPWQQDFLERLHEAAAPFEELGQEDFGLAGSSPVIDVSDFDVKLLKQFLATTVARLRRPNETPAVLEVRVLLRGVESLFWGVKESLFLYAYFKAFRSPYLLIRFTVLVNTAFAMPRNEEEFLTSHAESLEKIQDPTDRGEFVVEREEATAEESSRLR